MTSPLERWPQRVYMNKLIDEATQAKELREALLAARPFLYDPRPPGLAAFQVVAGGVPYVFVSKDAAREMRDQLNGMTLEGDL